MTTSSTTTTDRFRAFLALLLAVVLVAEEDLSILRARPLNLVTLRVWSRNTSCRGINRSVDREDPPIDFI